MCALACPCALMSMYGLREQRLRTEAKKRKGGCQVKAETSLPREIHILCGPERPVAQAEPKPVKFRCDWLVPVSSVPAFSEQPHQPLPLG